MGCLVSYVPESGKRDIVNMALVTQILEIQALSLLKLDISYDL